MMSPATSTRERTVVAVMLVLRLGTDAKKAEVWDVRSGGERREERVNEYGRSRGWIWCNL